MDQSQEPQEADRQRSLTQTSLPWLSNFLKNLNSFFRIGNTVTWYKNQNVEKNISEKAPSHSGTLPLNSSLQRQPMLTNSWCIPPEIFHHPPSIVCIYVAVYVCVYICMHTHTYPYLYTPIHVHTHTQRKKTHITNIRRERGTIITDLTDINRYYELNVCLSPKYAETITPSVMALGGGAFRR